jgi:hypothetical protein
METPCSYLIPTDVKLGDPVLRMTYTLLQEMGRESGLFPDCASYRAACILAEEAYYGGNAPGELPRLRGLTQKQTDAVDLALKAALERECAVIH